VAEQPKIRESKRGEKTSRGFAGLERERLRPGWEIPWGAGGTASTRPSRESARGDGRWAEMPCDYRSGQETSEGTKPKGASGGAIWLNPRPLRGLLGGVPYPEGEARYRGAGTNLRRGAALERAYGTVGGIKASKG
jgi:hypothetical protein